MARKEPVQERKICVIIRSEDKRKPVVLETWRYWEIVGELRWMGMDYPAATDAAKWCQRAKPGDINQVNLFVDERLPGERLPRYRKTGEIVMEVSNGTADKQKKKLMHREKATSAALNKATRETSRKNGF